MASCGKAIYLSTLTLGMGPYWNAHQLIGMLAGLCWASGAKAQSGVSPQRMFVWASTSNASLTVAVGYAKWIPLIVAGFSGTVGAHDQSLSLGGGVRFAPGTTRGRVVLEALLDTHGWGSQFTMAVLSTRGPGTAYGKVVLAYPLGRNATASRAHGYLSLHGQLSAHLRLGTAYSWSIERNQRWTQHLGPSLELRMIHGALRLEFNQGLRGASNELSTMISLAR